VLTAEPPGTWAVSDLTIAEFAGTLARWSRMRRLAVDRHELHAAWRGHVGPVFRRLTIGPDTYDLAAELLLAWPALGLRAADAVHLATAAQHEATLVTLDRTLLRAAEDLGLPATDGGVPPPG
jgi:predicted nucleic acid-binding protein